MRRRAKPGWTSARRRRHGRAKATHGVVSWTPGRIDPDGWIAVGEALLPDAIELRRAIHAEPELGLDLPKTTAKVKAALAGLPLEIREGPSTSGLVAILRGPANGRTVLLRGDMDALPLTEDTGLAFSSQHDGAMHACGHDTHVAMLAGAARALCERRDQLSGSVMFMFQPGEEGWHGARFMLEDGLLDPLPDAAFALHISPNMPRGVIAAEGRRDAGLLGQDPHQGDRQGRPRLDAAGRHRPDPGRLRDRHGAAGVHHAPHRCRRPGGDHHRPDRGRHHRQHHPRGRPPLGHLPHALRAHPRHGAGGDREGGAPHRRGARRRPPRSTSTAASR